MFEILRKNHMRVVQGDTAIFNINFYDYEFVDGDIVYFTVKKDIKDMDYVLQIIVSTFTDYNAIFKLNKDDTNIEVGNYIYDIQASLHNGIVDTIILPSKFEVIGGVTND